MNKKYKALILLVLLASLSLLAFNYLHHANIAVLNPKGPIAQKERNLIVFALALSLIVVIPVYALAIGFSWRYRESNHRAKYSPELDHSPVAETLWWLIPSALIVVLSVVTWTSSHQLDPYRPLNSTTKPMTIQAVAMDWKWLFIYPKQNIATVNLVQFPVNTPINFEITADAPMNSFWIPQLSGQIYAMAGMSTELHLEATTTGSYNGSSANISGQGFAGMSFVAKASSLSDFNNWLKDVKRSPYQLSLSTYNQLAQPSQNNPVAYYSTEAGDLYGSIIMRYMMPGEQGYIE